MSISDWSSDVCSSDLVAVIALVDHRTGDARLRNWPLDRLIVAVEYRHRPSRDDCPIAFFQIGYLLRKRRERQRVGTQIILVCSIADDQRRPQSRPAQHIGIATKHDTKRERPL